MVRSTLAIWDLNCVALIVISVPQRQVNFLLDFIQAIVFFVLLRHDSQGISISWESSKLGIVSPL